jgi:hypothetical protein
MTLTPLRSCLADRVRASCQDGVRATCPGPSSGRRSPRPAASRAAGRPAAPQRLRHERIRQHEPRLGDQRHRNGDIALFIALRVVAREQGVAIRDAAQNAPEALAAGDDLFGVDLGEVPGPAGEIARPDQRPVDSRRRHLEMIRHLDRIVDVERRRDCLAHGLAAFDGHRAVRLLRHDLHRAAVLAGDAHAHQPIAEIGDRRLDDGRDARGDAALDDDALVLIGCCCRLVHAWLPWKRMPSGSNQK